MESKTGFEFDKYKCKLENRCDNLFIRWQKIFAEGKKQRMLQRISKIQTISSIKLKNVEKR